MRVVGRRLAADEVVDDAVVAEHDVVAVDDGGLADVGGDRVVAAAAEDHVAAGAGADGVVAAVLARRDERLDQLEHVIG